MLDRRKMGIEGIRNRKINGDTTDYGTMVL